MSTARLRRRSARCQYGGGLLLPSVAGSCLRSLDPLMITSKRLLHFLPEKRASYWRNPEPKSELPLMRLSTLPRSVGGWRVKACPPSVNDTSFTHGGSPLVLWV